MEKRYLEINVKSDYGIEMTHKLPVDANLEELVNCFKSILVGLTFHPTTVEDVFNEEY